MRPLDSLLGARIARIDAPTAELFTLTLSAPGYKATLLVSLRAGASGVGLVHERPKGEAANSFVQKLRKELGGARLNALTRHGARVFELHALRGDGAKCLRFTLGAPANVQLLDARSQLLASLHRLAADGGAEPAPEIDAQAWASSLDELEASGRALLSRLTQSTLETERSALARSLATAQKRVLRRLEAIEADAARAGQASALRARATLVLANLHAIERGARSARLQDFTQDPPVFIEVTLDPALGAQAQAQAWFQLARRFERGQTLAAERARQTRNELTQLQELRAALETASTSDELASLQAQARKLGARAQQPAADGGKAKRRQTRTPYRELRGTGDRPILVGKGGADNDELTLKHARPHDLWLHARDVSGAHVIVPLERNEDCPTELLIDAAHLAAHFSSARGEPLVDIIYVPRRHLRKPKGSPPGSIQVSQEKVLPLRLDPPRLTRLLTTEQH